MFSEQEVQWNEQTKSNSKVHGHVINSTQEKSTSELFYTVWPMISKNLHCTMYANKNVLATKITE